MTDLESAKRATGIVKLFLGERLELAGETLGLREAVTNGVLERIDAINSRFREQFDHLRTPSSRRIPDAYYADEQEAENELQKAAAGIRAALALGGTIGDPIETERDLASVLSPTGTWALRSEASRVPRPATRPAALDWSHTPIPWVGDENAEWPPADAVALAGARQFAGAESVRVAEVPYTDWVQLGFVERQRTLASRFPKIPGRQIILMAGLEVCDDDPLPNSVPLSGLPPTLWARPYADLVDGLDRAQARDLVSANRKPLAGLVYYDRQPGAPARDRGPGLHPFCLTPQLEIAALLDLRPETPAIRHVLIDDSGCALVCRHWRSFLIHAGDYGPLEHAVQGADLIVRPDLYETIEATIGRSRIDLGITVRYQETAEPGDDHDDE